MNDTEYPRIVIKYHLSATNGREGYEITANEKAMPEDVDSALAAATEARTAVRQTMGLDLETQLDKSLAEGNQ